VLLVRGKEDTIKNKQTWMICHLCFTFFN
jgi:hypothetical protein